MSSSLQATRVLTPVQTFAKVGDNGYLMPIKARKALASIPDLAKVGGLSEATAWMMPNRVAQVLASIPALTKTST